ncbi:hypothetical protein [Vagococcus fluvialis]|uniref:hypothetical protein n=1 Tax=Vagococcus fluvialis TaxID=2738 RepID=UPI003B2186BA
MALEYNIEKITIPSFNEMNLKLDTVQGFVIEVEKEKEQVYTQILKLKEDQKLSGVKLDNISDTLVAAKQKDDTEEQIKVLEKQLDYLNLYLLEKTGGLFKEAENLRDLGVLEVKDFYTPYTLIVNYEIADKTDAVANKLNDITRTVVNRFNQLLDSTGHFDPLSTIDSQSGFGLKHLDMQDGAVILYGHQIKKLIGGY